MMPTDQTRRAQASDGPALLALWERAVRATHDFLTEAGIDVHRPLVADLLAFVVVDRSEQDDAGRPQAALRLRGSAAEVDTDVTPEAGIFGASR